MDKKELIMTTAKELLIEGIRKDRIEIISKGSDKPASAAGAYSAAMDTLVSKLTALYNSI